MNPTSPYAAVKRAADQTIITISDFVNRKMESIVYKVAMGAILYHAGVYIAARCRPFYWVVTVLYISIVDQYGSDEDEDHFFHHEYLSKGLYRGWACRGIIFLFEAFLAKKGSAQLFGYVGLPARFLLGVTGIFLIATGVFKEDVDQDANQLVQDLIKDPVPYAIDWLTGYRGLYKG